VIYLSGCAFMVVSSYADARRHPPLSFYFAKTLCDPKQQMMAFSVAFWRLAQQVVVKRIFGLVPPPCSRSIAWGYVAMLFWALLASGQINMRKVDGWQTLATAPIDQPIDLAP